MDVQPAARRLSRGVVHGEHWLAAVMTLAVHVIFLGVLFAGHASHRDIDGQDGHDYGESLLRIRWVGVAPLIPSGQNVQGC